MKKSKHTFTLILMVSSIILLLALQGFWLKSSYERAYFDLRREASSDRVRTTSVSSLRPSRPA
ncbi:MAG: hypothetical protein MUF39_09955, partial [Cyclobacteriaceae bacterium]|nr:hypothetical protein [Cyclobacteriaceae bacterium]